MRIAASLWKPKRLLTVGGTLLWSKGCWSTLFRVPNPRGLPRKRVQRVPAEIVAISPPQGERILSRFGECGCARLSFWIHGKMGKGEGIRRQSGVGPGTSVDVNFGNIQDFRIGDTQLEERYRWCRVRLGVGVGSESQDSRSVNIASGRP
ncbi:hypothetical protein C8J57DRAFT_1243036 [Mycena rebaudengoi]|nr:hypothetical protein C8J57DRAFT_1243036 [Mycena rebaudengoi]